ncbi:MAG TPA: hypothetical protein VKV04_03870, partial [Verrucomicrobiae bacterium]|nr:hypothetical protein [Verrucomicrobiae bacterium]
MQTHPRRTLFVRWAACLVIVAGLSQSAIADAPEPMTIETGWQLQDVGEAPQTGAEISSLNFKPKGWYAATVPGTVLTTLVNNGVYPEPLYGENNRPDKIPDSLCRTSYWYRAVFT